MVINILGKIPHKELKKIVSEFDCNINLTGTGFFDKAVLETLHAGLINICYNEDYKQFFSSVFQDKLFIKSSLNELERIFETVIALNQKEIESIKSFGTNFGMAFQLIDDAIDYTSTNDSLGKNIGDDFKEGKITLPIILAYLRSDNN